VAGRDISISPLASEPRGARRLLAWAAAGFALLGLGIAIGSRIATPETTTMVTTVSETVTTERPTARQTGTAPVKPTQAGAVAAAAYSITAFDGDVLLDPTRLHALVDRIASTSSRAQLIGAFDQASAQTRAKLGADTIPRPVILLRSVPLGYRVESFSPKAATIAVWYVGVVGSGATVEPQQSWRTQVVSLVWERRSWKVSNFDSSPGPTPPLSTTESAQTPAELFASIPGFQAFGHAEP